MAVEEAGVAGLVSQQLAEPAAGPCIWADPDCKVRILSQAWSSWVMSALARFQLKTGHRSTEQAALL